MWKDSGHTVHGQTPTTCLISLLRHHYIHDLRRVLERSLSGPKQVQSQCQLSTPCRLLAWPIFSSQGYFVCCPHSRISGMHGFSCPPITFKAVFVHCCEKWQNCIWNGLWVERQAWWFEGWACPVSDGICVSEGSGSLLCCRLRRITMTLGIISSTQPWLVVL